MTNKPIFSFIFLYWNAPEWTLTSLESIRKYMSVPFELIIVNNGSDQELVDKVKTKANEIAESELCTKIVISNIEENLGVTKGFNTGRKYVNDETTIISYFCNDWAITPNWDKKVLEAFNTNPRIGMVTSTTNYGQGSMINDKRNPNAELKNMIQPFQKDFWTTIEEIAKRQNRTNLTSMNDFVCMGFCVRKNCYTEVGDFDERIQTANDVWFSKVAFKLGWLSVTAWGPYIQHGFHQSFKQLNDPKTYEYIKPKEQEDFILMQNDERCN